LSTRPFKTVDKDYTEYVEKLDEHYNGRTQSGKKKITASRAVESRLIHKPV